PSSEKLYVRRWLASRVPMKEQPDAILADESLRDRELWEHGFKSLALTSAKKRVFIDRFFDLFDLWDRKRWSFMSHSRSLLVFRRYVERPLPSWPNRKPRCPPITKLSALAMTS